MTEKLEIYLYDSFDVIKKIKSLNKNFVTKHGLI